LSVAYLCLGSNLEDREKNLLWALALLSREINLEKTSSVYETEPVDCEEQLFFLNLVCRITTTLNPRELLYLAKVIENKMGRIPSRQINAPRPIDIDILFYDMQIIKSNDLIIPHPRLVERAFVLIPLSEIAPELVHPEFGSSVVELVSRVEGCGGVQKYN